MTSGDAGLRLAVVPADGATFLWRAQLSSGRSLVRACVASALILLAFLTPSVLAPERSNSIGTESWLARVVYASFGGVTLPVVGAVTAALLLGVGSPLRARTDRVVAAGHGPRSAFVAPLVFTVLCAMVSASVTGAVLVALVRLAFAVGDFHMLWRDVLGTAWAIALGSAAWTAVAALFISRTGRPLRGYLVVLVDIASRLLPGDVAWLFPGPHVANLLGAPPWSGIVRLSVTPQYTSVLVALLYAVGASLVAIRRYHGATAR